MVDIDWDSDAVRDELRWRLKRILGWIEEDPDRCASATLAGTRCTPPREDVEDCIQCWQHRP